MRQFPIVQLLSVILLIPSIAPGADGHRHDKTPVAEKKPSVVIPEENQKKGEIPSMAPAEKMGRLMVDAINQKKPQVAASAFFPADPFRNLKGIQDPDAYHKQLVSWFEQDLQREQIRYEKELPLTYLGFQKGSCKWKEPGSEANTIAYWSCYRNQMKVKTSKGAEVTIKVRVMINWGSEWYVTHLGPIPGN